MNGVRRFGGVQPVGTWGYKVMPVDKKREHQDGKRLATGTCVERVLHIRDRKRSGSRITEKGARRKERKNLEPQQSGRGLGRRRFGVVGGGLAGVGTPV